MVKDISVCYNKILFTLCMTKCEMNDNTPLCRVHVVSSFQAGSLTISCSLLEQSYFGNIPS